jgi:hypothetical protein
MQTHLRSDAVEIAAQLGLDEFRRDQRIGHIVDIDRHLGRAREIGKPQPLERPDQPVVHPALHDDPGRALGTEDLVHSARPDEGLGGGPAGVDLVLLMGEGHRRQHHPGEIAVRGG